MKCGCSIDIDYDHDPSSVWLESRVTKISSRRCDECWRPIPAGELMLVAREHSEDEDLNTTPTQNRKRYYTCLDCESIRKTYFCSFSYSSILEDLWERIDEAPEDFANSQLAELTTGARETVCKMIEDAWANIEDEGPEKEAA